MSMLLFAVNIDEKISEFEFEFCLDSDGFIKNRDYKIPNYQVFLIIFSFWLINKSS